MEYIGKEYKFDRQENFDGFLKAVGLPDEQIAKVMEYKPSIKLLKDGDKYTYVTSTPEGSKESTFESGVEFDDTIGPKNVPVKTTYTVNGNVVTQVIKADKGTGTFKREYNGDELVVTVNSSIWDGTARRYYKA